MHFESMHVAEARPTGLPGVPDVPWGTHLCQFYRTREELIETLVPFFKAGLDCGERCIGVVAEPLSVAEVLDALRAAIPELDARLATGDLELADPAARYAAAHGGSPRGTVAEWVAEEAAAIVDGYAGLRILGNVPPARAAQWDSVMAYEAEVQCEFASRRIVAICSYPLDACGEDQIVDALSRHGAALVRREGRTELIRSATVVLASALGDGERTLDPTAPHGHLVRFFTDHAYPADSIADFLCRGLARGARAYALATPDHLTQLREALRERGADVDGDARERVTLRDASALAGEVLAGEAPATVLDRHVAPELEAVLARGEMLCVYGELVDQLCRADLVAAALDAERWWNRTRARGAVELLCGYSFEGFARSHAPHGFTQVVAQHDGVDASQPARSTDLGRIVAELEQSSLALQHESELRRVLERQRDLLRDAERIQRERAQQANDHLARLQLFTTAIAEATGADEIANRVVSVLPAVFHASEARFGIERDGRLHVYDGTGAPPSVATDQDPAPVALVHRSGEPLWLLSPAEIAARLADDAGDAVALLCAPVRCEQRCLGAIELRYRRGGAGAYERALLEDCARQLALSLDRAGAYDAAHRARAGLQRLADATRRIAEARLDVADVVRTVVREVTDSGLSRVCGIHLLSEDRTRLVSAGVRHVDPARQERIEEFSRGLPATPGTGILGTVVGDGRALRFQDAESLLARAAPEYRAELLALDVCSLMCVPLRATGEILGVMTVARDADREPFGEDDQRGLQELADRAALALQNAQLYENAQRQRERAERECARAEQERERASEASRAKDEFLAMLGHELRNPLSPMLTAIQLMRLRAEHVFEKERTIIERQVHHMVRLIDDLLDVSRITRGKVKLTLQPLELARVVASAIETATPLLENGTHHLAIDVPRGLVVMADLDRLAQVIVNLLTNAARYTPEGGTITLDATSAANTIAFAVRDTGVGIDAALLPHVFDLFVQGKQASHRPHGGLGLGLAISKSLVTMHGGTLRAESEGVGCGATFTIELPRVDPATVQTVPRPAELAPPIANGHRVLVVDDNVDGCETLATALSTVGYEVRCAYDGPSALSIAREFQPRLALLDLGLPGMDGYELAQRLAELPALTALHMIAISGYGQPADRARSLEVGFREHLVKPVDFHGLQRIAAKLLEN